MMRNVPHPEISGYEKTHPPASTSANVFPNSKRNHPLDVPRLTTVRAESQQNEVDRNGAAVQAGLGSDAANYERSCVLAILRGAYRAARGEYQRIQSDLDLLVGIARAVEAGIYEPAFAIERAVEHGLVARPDVAVAP